MVRIKVVDQIGHGLLQQGLAYTHDEDAKTSVWSGMIKNRAGTLHAHLCPGCKQVSWYATPDPT